MSKQTKAKRKIFKNNIPDKGLTVVIYKDLRQGLCVIKKYKYIFNKRKNKEMDCMYNKLKSICITKNAINKMEEPPTKWKNVHQ